MNLEMLLVGENGRERTTRFFMLDRTMQLRAEIGRREMHAAVVRIRRWTHRRRVRSPHRRSRTRSGQQFGRFSRSTFDYCSVITGETKATQQLERRPFERRQHALVKSKVGQLLHLAQTLLRRGL